MLPGRAGRLCWCAAETGDNLLRWFVGGRRTQTVGNGRDRQRPSCACTEAAAPGDYCRRTASFATYSPWKRARASSLALGWREPSLPAMVAAPYGEPARSSLVSVSSGAL